MRSIHYQVFSRNGWPRKTGHLFLVCFPCEREHAPTSYYFAQKKFWQKNITECAVFVGASRASFARMTLTPKLPLHTWSSWFMFIYISKQSKVSCNFCSRSPRYNKWSDLSNKAYRYPFSWLLEASVNLIASPMTALIALEWHQLLVMTTMVSLRKQLLFSRLRWHSSWKNFVLQCVYDVSRNPLSFQGAIAVFEPRQTIDMSNVQRSDACWKTVQPSDSMYNKIDLDKNPIVRCLAWIIVAIYT